MLAASETLASIPATAPHALFFMVGAVGKGSLFIVTEGNRAESHTQHSHVGSPVDVLPLGTFRIGSMCQVQVRKTKKSRVTGVSFNLSVWQAGRQEGPSALFLNNKCWRLCARVKILLHEPS